MSKRACEDRGEGLFDGLAKEEAQRRQPSNRALAFACPGRRGVICEGTHPRRLKIGGIAP